MSAVSDPFKIFESVFGSFGGAGPDGGAAGGGGNPFANMFANMAGMGGDGMGGNNPFASMFAGMGQGMGGMPGGAPSQGPPGAQRARSTQQQASQVRWVPKNSPYGSVCCACAQRPGLPRASPSRARGGHKNIVLFSKGPKLRYPPGSWLQLYCVVLQICLRDCSLRGLPRVLPPCFVSTNHVIPCVVLAVTVQGRATRCGAN